MTAEGIVCGGVAVKARHKGEVLERVREELRSNADHQTRDRGRRFFKEEVRLYGVKTAMVSAIARKSLTEIRAAGKAEVFALCEVLWQSGYLEESFIACEWAYAFRVEFVPNDFPIFERWVSRYVSNWAQCDTLCNPRWGPSSRRIRSISTTSRHGRTPTTAGCAAPPQ
jgi:3-methyladenine DNA glycosylase AlkD